MCVFLCVKYAPKNSQNDNIIGIRIFIAVFLQAPAPDKTKLRRLKIRNQENEMTKLDQRQTLNIGKCRIKNPAITTQAGKMQKLAENFLFRPYCMSLP